MKISIISFRPSEPVIRSIADFRKEKNLVNAGVPYFSRTGLGPSPVIQLRQKSSKISRRTLLFQDRIGSKYHRDILLSLLCSEWEKVGHSILNHREILRDFKIVEVDIRGKYHRACVLSLLC